MQRHGNGGLFMFMKLLLKCKRKKLWQHAFLCTHTKDRYLTCVVKKYTLYVRHMTYKNVGSNQGQKKSGDILICKRDSFEQRSALPSIDTKKHLNW